MPIIQTNQAMPHSTCDCPFEHHHVGQPHVHDDIAASLGSPQSSSSAAILAGHSNATHGAHGHSRLLNDRRRIVLRATPTSGNERDCSYRSASTAGAAGSSSGSSAGSGSHSHSRIPHLRNVPTWHHHHGYSPNEHELLSSSTGRRAQQHNHHHHGYGHATGHGILRRNPHPPSPSPSQPHSRLHIHMHTPSNQSDVDHGHGHHKLEFRSRHSLQTIESCSAEGDSEHSHIPTPPESLSSTPNSTPPPPPDIPEWHVQTSTSVAQAGPEFRSRYHEVVSVAPGGAVQRGSQYMYGSPQLRASCASGGYGDMGHTVTSPPPDRTPASAAAVACGSLTGPGSAPALAVPRPNGSMASNGNMFNTSSSGPTSAFVPGYQAPSEHRAQEPAPQTPSPVHADTPTPMHNYDASLTPRPTPHGEREPALTMTTNTLRPRVPLLPPSTLYCRLSQLTHQKLDGKSDGLVLEDVVALAKRDTEIKVRTKGWKESGGEVPEGFRVLGSSLEEVLMYASKPVEIGEHTHDLPILVVACVEELNRTGIYQPFLFRALPSRAQHTLLLSIYDSSTDFGLRFTPRGQAMPGLCALLASFVGALPEPLLPRAIYEPLWTWAVNPSVCEAERKAAEEEDEELRRPQPRRPYSFPVMPKHISPRSSPEHGQIKAEKERKGSARDAAEREQIRIAQVLLRMAPRGQASLLAYLCGFLAQVEFAPENGMSFEDVARIFAASMLGGGKKSARDAESLSFATMERDRGDGEVMEPYGREKGRVQTDANGGAGSRQQSECMLVWLLERWSRISDGLFSETCGLEPQQFQTSAASSVETSGGKGKLGARMRPKSEDLRMGKEKIKGREELGAGHIRKPSEDDLRLARACGYELELTRDTFEDIEPPASAARSSTSQESSQTHDQQPPQAYDQAPGATRHSLPRGSLPPSRRPSFPDLGQRGRRPSFPEDCQALRPSFVPGMWCGCPWHQQPASPMNVFPTPSGCGPYTPPPQLYAHWYPHPSDPDTSMPPPPGPVPPQPQASSYFMPADIIAPSPFRTPKHPDEVQSGPMDIDVTPLPVNMEVIRPLNNVKPNNSLRINVEPERNGTESPAAVAMASTDDRTESSVTSFAGHQLQEHASQTSRMRREKRGLDRSGQSDIDESASRRAKPYARSPHAKNASVSALHPLVSGSDMADGLLGHSRPSRIRWGAGVRGNSSGSGNGATTTSGNESRSARAVSLSPTPYVHVDELHTASSASLSSLAINSPPNSPPKQPLTAPTVDIRTWLQTQPSPSSSVSSSSSSALSNTGEHKEYLTLEDSLKTAGSSPATESANLLAEAHMRIEQLERALIKAASGEIGKLENVREGSDIGSDDAERLRVELQVVKAERDKAQRVVREMKRLVTVETA